ncbi:YbhB/YbcL family Raf kinase inhibitor-like protein [Paenibacillus sp. CN-4]|uniref:YbhB/YbcL family Raf kinase inhibitor-like protein n=1 Tax=Paenibacillus nanchangensis TaxID=3348343 RepID=UPI0039784CCD
MIVTSTGIIDGYIQDRFGKRGTDFNEAGVPSRSLPLSISGYPEGTVGFALVLEDIDAYPVVGFSWVHWTAANLPRPELLENESMAATDWVQGANSWISPLGGSLDRMRCSQYGGMTPPDRPHEYELRVYALSATLDLTNGFYLNELYRAMDGKVLGTALLRGIYRH